MDSRGKGIADKGYSVFGRLGIRHFDLLDTLKDAIASGITLGEQPGDTWDPSEEVSKLFADTLLVEGIFQGKKS